MDHTRCLPLTVRAHQADSHKEKGWEQFTKAVVSWLREKSNGLVFLLWSSHAQRKGSAIYEAPPRAADCPPLPAGGAQRVLWMQTFL